MDLITLALAKNYTNQIGAAGLTSVSYDSTTSEIVAVYATDPVTTIRYTIPTLQGRGISNTVLNADYTLTITYTDGTTYTTPSIRGPQGPQGEQGPKGEDGAHTVAVSNTGTSTNLVKYITIDGTESKMGMDISVSNTGTSTNKVKYITIDGVESKMSSDIIDNLSSTDTESALSANQGRILNTSLGSKADLEGGKVPLSQLPTFIIADVVEYPTRQDFPASGSTSTIYVAKDTGKSYRWVGSDYVEISNANAYYSATPTATTMGDLRTYINNVNNSGLHCFFDLHNAISDGYVCTVHMYTENGTNYCQILDLLSHVIYFNPSGYTDATTVVAYCSAPGNHWASPRDVQINGGTIISNEIANINLGTGLSFNTATKTLNGSKVVIEFLGADE